MTSFETLQKACNILSGARQTEYLSTLTPHQLLTLGLGCLRSDWDVTTDHLGNEQMRKLLTGEWTAPKFDHNMHPAGGVPCPARGKLARRWVVKHPEHGYWDLGAPEEGGTFWQQDQIVAAKFTNRAKARLVADRLGGGARIVRLRRRPSRRDLRLANILTGIIAHLDFILRPVPPLARAAEMPVLGLHGVLAELEGDQLADLEPAKEGASS